MKWLIRCAAIATLFCSGHAFAVCRTGHFINPITDVDWDCLFPISIAGFPVDYGEHPPDDTSNDFVCQCPGQGALGVGLGFPVQFWEPAMLMDTVSDAWCFPAIGANLGNIKTGIGYTGGGMYQPGVGNGALSTSFSHFHYYIFPVWAILNMFSDIPCLQDNGNFNLAMVSEVRPDWGDDTTAMQLYPETALMGNEAVVMACMADAVAATAKRPIDALYWCMGSWGDTYPMTGNITAKDIVEANAGAAARALYVQSRDLTLADRATNLCSDTYLPIWTKSHYRFQEIDPVVDDRCHAVGEPGLLWTQGKAPVGMGDNYSWLIFRKVHCCVLFGF